MLHCDYLNSISQIFNSLIIFFNLLFIIELVFYFNNYIFFSKLEIDSFSILMLIPNDHSSLFSIFLPFSGACSPVG